MHKDFDLAIIGASFAGLAAARTAAMRGLKVAVIERKTDPGAQVRTTGIVVKEAADTLDIPAELTRKVRGVRLYAPNLSYSDHWKPGYYFQMTNTPALLRWLAGEAERAGARLFLGQKFTGATEGTERVSLAGAGLTARFLIGADGAQSAVARCFGLERNLRFLSGIEAEAEPLLSVDPRFLHCFAESQIAPGYIAWAALGAGVTQIGLAASGGRRPDLQATLRHIGRAMDLGGLKVTGFRRGLIPVSGALRRTSTARVLLIGDAAGHCSPLTGGGIQLAFKFGRRAAQLVSDYLCDEGAHPALALARESPRFFVKGVMRRALDLRPPNTVINWAFGVPFRRTLTDQIYFHARGDAAQEAPIAPEAHSQTKQETPR